MTDNPAAANLERSPARRYFWFFLRFAVGMGLIVYLVGSGAIELRWLSRLLSAWPVSLAGLVLIFADIALMAVRLSGLLSPQGSNLSFEFRAGSWPCCRPLTLF